MRKLIFGEKGRYFILAALFASFASFVALSDSFRKYEAEVTAIVIPKSEKTAVSLRETIGNVALLASSESFQDSLIDESGSELGRGDDLPTAERRDALAKVISVRASETGGSLSIRAVSDDPDEAESLSHRAALSLFRFAGQYYNVKEDVDFRIVSGPVSRSVSDVFLHTLASLGIGALVAAAFFLLLELIPGAVAMFFGKKREGKTVFPAEVFEPKRPESPFFDERLPDEEFIPREERFPEPEEPSAPEPEPRSVRTLGKKSGAPLNLPAMSAEEERFLNEFSFEERPEEEIPEGEPETTTSVMEEPEAPAEVSSEPTGPIEPTEEEYKRRLNELLRG